MTKNSEDVLGPAEKNNKKYRFKKRYLKTRPVCKVTFTLPKDAALTANHVTIVGEFNNWDKEANPMTKTKEGDFRVTIDLEAGKDYCFRYLIDASRWANDWYADRYVPNPFGGDDSVVSVKEPATS